MKLKIVSLKTAKKLKQIGFDLECINYYGRDKIKNKFILNTSFNRYDYNYNGESFLGSFSAPTISLVKMWLREKYNLHIIVNPWGDLTHWTLCNITRIDKIERYERVIFEIADKHNNTKFKTYEEAIEIGILESIKLIKLN